MAQSVHDNIRTRDVKSQHTNVHVQPRGQRGWHITPFCVASLTKSPMEKARAKVEAASTHVAVHYAIVVDGAIHAEAKVGAVKHTQTST